MSSNHEIFLRILSFSLASTIFIPSTLSILNFPRIFFTRIALLNYNQASKSEAHKLESDFCTSLGLPQTKIFSVRLGRTHTLSIPNDTKWTDQLQEYNYFLAWLC